MKRRFGLVAVVLLTAVIILFGLPFSAFAADMGDPKVTDVKYVEKDGKKTGIKSFTIAPYTYHNLSQDASINPGGGPTISLSYDKLRDIAAKQIFPRWSVIAENIFRDQADQLVTIEGSGMMSSSKTAENSFDRQFNYGKKGVNSGYSDYGWSVKDLAEKLKSTSSSHDGELCWDEVRATGITSIGNLAGARRLMGQELRNCSDDNDISTDEFLGNGKQKTDNKYRLPDLEKTDTGSGFASVVTCVNRRGASGDYDYATFGIAVYDFDVTPVAAKDLKYIEAADSVEDGRDILMGNKGNYDASGIKFAENDKEATSTYLRNKTPDETVHEAALKNTKTESSTITTQDTYQFSLSESIGFSVSWGKIVDGITAPRCTLTTSMTSSELWSTMQGKSNTKTVGDEKGINTQVKLPGYTVAKVTQNTNDRLTAEEYQQPVILSYKVAVYAMSGDYYNGVTGGIDPGTYDKQWMSVLFDGSDQADTAGCKALSSLYTRAIKNKDTQGYDGAKGKYRSWCDKGAWNSSNKIDWGNVASEMTDANEDRASHNVPSMKTGQKSTLEDIATEYPLIERASNLESSQLNVSSSVEQMVALYPLDSVELQQDSKSFTTRPADVFHLEGLKLRGLNSKSGEFYGFKQNWGEWKLCDTSGTPIEDQSDDDEDPEEGKVKLGKFTLCNDSDTDSQYVETDHLAEHGDKTRLKWMLDLTDDTRIISNENLTSDEPYMSAEDREKVKTPSITLSVNDEASDAASVEISGSYNGLYTDRINLGRELTAHVIDTTGKVAGFPIYWEDKGIGDINVSDNGDTTFGSAGTYKVRAYTYNRDADKIYSDWVDIRAKEEEVLTTINLVRPQLEEDDLLITEKYPVKTINVAGCLEFLDQYGDRYDAYYDNDAEEGKKWVKRDVPEIEFTVDDDEENAFITDEGIMNVMEPGTYIVSARAYEEDENGNRDYLNYGINDIKIKVAREDWLEYVELEEPAMSAKELRLQNKDDVVVVKDLASQLRYYDQDHETWEGKKPAITFVVDAEKDSAEVKNGNLYIYKPGRYMLYAVSNSFYIDPVSISVTENEELVIKVIDPSTLKITEQDREPFVNLDRYVDYTTRFGGKWNGTKPEVEFALDSGVTGAKIERRIDDSVSEGDENDVKEYWAFVATEPGDYRVHVTVNKTSEYPDPIDDIIIRAEEYKTVDAITLDMERDLKDKDPVINSFDDEEDKIEFSLKDRVVYLDKEGEILDPKSERVAVPDLVYGFYENEEVGITKPEEGEAEIKDGMLIAYKPGRYYVTVDPVSGNARGTVAQVLVNDITWAHDFGEWEVKEPEDSSVPACERETVIVRKCKGHDRNDDGEIGEDETCDVELTETIPAPGHNWNSQFNAGQFIGYPLTVRCLACSTVRVYKNPTTSYRIVAQGTLATCNETGTTKLLDQNSQELEVLEVPARGHYFMYDHTEVKKDATCNEEGIEVDVLKCAHEGCEEKREINERKIPKLDHDPQSEEELTEATCTEPGHIRYSCKNCHETYIDAVIRPQGHNWGNQSYEWSEDNKTVTATATCLRDGCGETLEETREMTVSVAEEPTCEEKGTTRYTAQFTNEAFGFQEETGKDIEPLGHEWNEPEYVWSDDHKNCTATAVCKRDQDHVLTETVKAESIMVEAPSCEEMGWMKYTADFESDVFGKKYAIEEELPAFGHIWGEPTYMWSKDFDTCTATSVCLKDPMHVETETVDTKTDTIAPTCTENGKIKYIAEFSDRAFVTQRKYKESTPAKGHSWNKGQVVKKATVSSEGVRQYTCAVCKATKTQTIAKLAKKANPLKVKGKTATVKYSKLKKKTQTLAVTKVIMFTKKGQGKMTYTLSTAKKGKKSFKKYFKINKTTGKVTVKKGLKKGTCKVKVKVKAAGNTNYKASVVKTVTFKIKVK